MGFADFLFPASTPLYPPAATVLTYLESYADHFDLRPHIHFNTSVINAEYTLNEVSPSGQKMYAWNVSTQSVDSEQQNRFKFDWLLVCNGHYSVPRYPSIPGLSTWVASKKVSHSATYRNLSLLPLPNSAKMLVVGGGPSRR
jgi:cation diffusion facilitator CzcD-associated flavoprotein CzcO